MTVHLGHKTSKFHRIVSALNTEKHFCHMRAIINYYLDSFEKFESSYIFIQTLNVFLYDVYINYIIIYYKITLQELCFYREIFD